MNTVSKDDVMLSADLAKTMGDIAITGLALRLPGGVESLDELWVNLLNGRDLVSEIEPERWAVEELSHPRRGEPGRSITFKAGIIGDVSQFDADFFGISPREAELMDPQQRLVLELAWEALEDAGLSPGRIAGTDCAVYLGISGLDYGMRVLDDLSTLSGYTMTGNTMSIAANRLSFKLDLRGPSVAVDTACSSAMVALHQACQTLRTGEAKAALVGSVNLLLHPYPFVGFTKASMLSAEGRCRTFAEGANGYVRAEGGGMMLLRPLADAVRDGDRVLGVIRASGVNNDGARKTGLTIPSSEAQQRLMQEVLTRSGLVPDDIDYLEAHGTGTSIGDPAEARAIGAVYGQNRAQALPIGSIKSNLGHMEPASGIAGLAKALLVLRHGVVPPGLHAEILNNAIDFEALGLDVVRAPQPLPNRVRRRVAVNSFGFGGVNAHVILEAPPVTLVEAEQPTHPLRHLVISARTEKALRALAGRYAVQLAALPVSARQAVAAAAWSRRTWLPERLAIKGELNDEAVADLAHFAQSLPAPRLLHVRSFGPLGRVGFIYSGNGAQWSGMGRRLAAACPDFSRALAEVAEQIVAQGGPDVLAALADESEAVMADTQVAQPALFALQVAMTQGLRSRGVEAVGAMGHSVGEIAAAWASGALSLEMAARVIVARSRAQGQTRGRGGMAAVMLGADDVAARIRAAGLTDMVEIAAINSPENVTVSGSDEALVALLASLRGVVYKRLDLDYAFHSAQMDPIRADMAVYLDGLQPGLGSQTTFYSSVTGDSLAPTSLTADYWWQNVRAPVRFEAAVARMAQAGCRVFLEIGPHAILQRYIKETLAAEAIEAQILATAPQRGDTLDNLETAALGVILAGPEPESAVGPHVALPSYPWQRQRHWVKPTVEAYRLIERRAQHELLGYRLKEYPAAWEVHLDSAKLPALADHKVGGAVVLAGAAYLEMALAAAREWFGHEHAVVEDMRILAPVVFEDGHARTLRLIFSPADLRFQIEGRPRLADVPWTVHAQGRLLEGDTLAPAVSIPLPTEALSISQAVHYATALSVGLEYGPRYQGLAEIRLDAKTLEADLAWAHAAPSTDGRYIVHPAIMDQCFQAMLGWVARAEIEMGYLPISFERLRVWPQAGQVVRLRGRLHRFSRHAACADFELLNKEGGLVARLEGARFRAASLHRREVPPGRWVTRVVPQALPGLEPVLPEWSFAIASHAARQRFYTEVLPLIEMLPLAYVRDALRLGGVELQSAWAQGSTWQRWLLALARSETLIDVDGHLQSDGLPETSEIWRTALALCPDAAEWLLRIGRVGMALASNPWQKPTVLAEKSDMPSVSPLQADADEAMLVAVKALLKVWPSGRGLRILDIGTNGPCWFGRLRSVLPDQGLKFVAARQDESLCAGLQTDLGGVIEVVNLDPSVFSLAQMAVAQFDLILVSHALHNVPAYSEVLRQIAGRLAPDGLLFMTECAPDAVSRFIGVSNAASPREGEGLVSCRIWEERLRQLGWTLRAIHKDEEQIGQELGGFLLVAAPPPRAVAARTAALACQIRAQGELAGALQKKIEEEGGQVSDELMHPAHVVIFASCATLCPTASDLARLCEQLREQLLSIATQTKQARIWVVTRGGALLDVPGSTPVRPGDAALWGLVRCAANELDPAQITLVDLPDFSAVWAEALFAELVAGSDETEIILTQAGRFVTRTIKEQETHPPSAEKNWRLDFNLAGQLRNLQWSAVDRPAPKDDEIEIETKAAGLNFRDVMFATGLLPEEALENGFAGPTLGLEVAGRVARVGAKVTKFQPGDAVLAFAGGSLAGYVNVPARTVAKYPEHWSYTEAATVPTVFFTVWYALTNLARLEPGETVVIHGAAGGIGVAAIQIAKLLGAKVIASAGTQARRDFALLLGAETVINSRSPRFDQELLDITGGEGVDIIINSLAGEAINRNLRLMKPFGRFIELGKRDFYENTAIGLKPFRNNVSYFGVDADQLMKVRPELAQRVFGEVMQAFAEGALHPLPARVFLADEVVNAFRYMQQAKQIGKVVVDLSLPPQAIHDRASLAVKLKAEATYLVTGGLNGFGLETALWLVSRGARHLALISRRGESEDATAKLASVRAQGVEVRSFACDVTNREELGAVLEIIEGEMKPLAGIVHAAMVLDDGMLPALTQERFRTVLAPKIDGAWALHELTLKYKLDMFLLFSSGTTLLGNHGQANYVAANAALEGVALLRRQQGLAACCVGWGPIADVGVLTRNETARTWLEHKLGITPLLVARALRELDGLDQSGSTNCAVMDINWGVLQARLPHTKIPRFSGMAQYARQMPAKDKEELAHRLKSLPESEARQALVEMLEAEIADILRLPIERIKGAQSLSDFGMDSLMAVEFAMALEKHLGVTVQPMLISQATDLEAIATRLLAMVRGGGQTDEPDLSLQAELRRHGEDLETTLEVK